MQRILSGLDIGHLVENHVHQSGTVGIQRRGLDIRCFTHAVVNLKVSSLEVNTVGYARAVIIIIVILMGGHAELVLPRRKDRSSKEVTVTSVRFLRHQIHFYLLPIESFRCPGFQTVIIILFAVKRLFIGHLYRCAIHD